MNFFAAQEKARHSTRLLVLWFGLGVAGVILTVYLVVTTLLQFSSVSEVPDVHAVWWNPTMLMWTSVIVGGIIIAGSLGKLSQLAAGGEVIARDLGGRRIDPSTRDFKERQLLNVVEEMAIASGVPVPGVWVMDNEPAINAFAAGSDPANAVVSVTRGTLDSLTRQELQGVVAHEFSHILNGDMKLNMRLSGWIFGLVMLSLVGRMMIESLRFIRGGRQSKGNGLVVVIAVLGITVWLAGLIGSLFAKLMQAAISRQREFLADASAVQFTRDPGGIAGALKKIGALSAGSVIQAAKASEASHMFFATGSLTSLFATHPPLADRIRAIDPAWDGRLEKSTATGKPPPLPSRVAGFAGAAAAPPDLGDIAAVDATAGAAMIASLPVATATLHESKAGAKALLLGLLIDAEQEPLAIETLRQSGLTQDEIEAAIRSCRDLSTTTTAQKLALLGRAMPTLRSMEPAEARAWIATCQALADADGQMVLFEFMMLQVIRRHLGIGLGLESVPATRHREITCIEPEVARLVAMFGTLARDPVAITNAALAYQEHTRRKLPVVTADFAEIPHALAEMEAATPLVKKQILRLCSLVVCHDGVVDEVEAQLLRATAEAIGAPLPPMPLAA